MPNNRRILVPRKWRILADMVAQGKTDAEIMLALGRPDLDVPWFRQTLKGGFKP